MEALSVRQVNSYIKRLFDTDIILSNIKVEGEISNYNHHYSGHRYFSLKDESGRLKCVMFKWDGIKLDKELKEGDKVIASGNISIYDKNGDYQLYVKSIEMQGVGSLYKKFEILKKKLEEQGLFDPKYKKRIPKMPKKIGVVTSATGAVIEDIINVINRRYPICDILLYPSLVQGDDAPKNLIRGIKYLDKRDDVDLIIIGRGGGSIDELFAFNDEELAFSIFNLKTPIISAVGHETDFTISDFVSDLRAPTPSAAAELAVPNIDDLILSLNRYKDNLIKILANKKMMLNKELESIDKNLKFNSPVYKLQEKQQNLDVLFKELINIVEKRINKERYRLKELDKNLLLKNPRIELDKGLAIVTDKNGKVINNISEINVKDLLNLNFKDGIVETKVSNVKEGKNV